MRTYGQYCPVARTSEILAERWTPIVRNLLTGCTTFGELRAGAPGIPKALLADRLATLRRAGIVDVVPNGRAKRYEVTARGRDLQPVLDAMGRWGMRWIEVEPHTEPAYVLWHGGGALPAHSPSCREPGELRAWARRVCHDVRRHAPAVSQKVASPAPPARTAVIGTSAALVPSRTSALTSRYRFHP